MPSSSSHAVRRAQGGDAAAIRTCLLAAFERYRSCYTAAAFADTVPPLPRLVARMDQMTVLVVGGGEGDIVGTVAYEVTCHGEGHLRGMAVDPRAQGGGVATALIQAVEQELASLGCERVTLDTTQALQRAIRFYERHGYRATGVVGDFFGMPLFEYAKHIG